MINKDKLKRFYNLKFINRCPDCGGILKNKKEIKTVQCLKCKADFRGYEDYNFLILLYIITILLIFVFNKGYLHITGLILSFVTIEIIKLVVNLYQFIKYEDNKNKRKGRK
ncbi:MAG: hypothetical protein ACOX1F_04230 [Erysipelotrichaceae bacterium]